MIVANSLTTNLCVLCDLLFRKLAKVAKISTITNTIECITIKQIELGLSYLSVFNPCYKRFKSSQPAKTFLQKVTKETKKRRHNA